MMTTAVLSTPDSTSVREHIDDAHRVKSMAQGFASFGGAAAIWIATLVGIMLLPWWAKIPLALINGSAISGLFLAGHDAGHGTLLPRRWLNRLIGRLSLLPALHPFTAWCHNHNALHHGFTNIKERDPGFPPLSPAEYARLGWLGRMHYRLCRTRLGLGWMYLTEMWLKWELFPTKARAPRNTRAFQMDRLIVIAFAAIWIGSLVVAAELTEQSWWINVLCGFVLPYAVWNWQIGFIIFQQHTHPRVPWYSQLDKPCPTYFQAQVKATPHIWFPGPIRFLMRNIMEHTAHHADAGVPLYHLPDAQHRISRVYKKEMVRVIWSRSVMRATLRTCRTYDYESHRWCDYDGTPLTAPLFDRSEVLAGG
jgi:acyl-lipid omega-6 desaturase (Delta-12 desaturase)